MNGHGAEHGRRPLPDAFRLPDELPTLRTMKDAKERHILRTCMNFVCVSVGFES